MLYLAADGDDVGNHLEYYVLINDIQSLTRFSAIFQSAMSWLRTELTERLDATIIICDGDTLLATLPSDHSSIEAIERIRISFAGQTQGTCTLSMGLGRTPREAYFALKLAKVSGKNRIQCIEGFANE
jgi:hypothetical protein